MYQSAETVAPSNCGGAQSILQVTVHRTEFSFRACKQLNEQKLQSLAPAQFFSQRYCLGSLSERDLVVDITEYVGQVRSKLAKTFPHHAPDFDPINAWRGLGFMATDFHLPDGFFPKELPFVFYDHYGLIAIVAASSFGEEFWSRHNYQYPFGEQNLYARAPAPALLRYELELHQYLDSEAFMKGLTWIRKPKTAVLVLVKTDRDDPRMEFEAYRWVNQSNDESILCLMRTDSKCPCLVSPPGTMIPPWRFIDRPGDLL
jgi:hypothetical protein